MLSRDTLSMDIGAKYFDGNGCFLQKAPQVFGIKTHHIRQFEKVYGMCTIITIIKADYQCLMSQLLLNILSNVTLPPYPGFFVHFKHTFVTHLTKISCFSITVTPPPRDTACPPPPQNSECAPSLSKFDIEDGVKLVAIVAMSDFTKDYLQSVSWSLAEFRHNKIVQSPHENYFNVC